MIESKGPLQIKDNALRLVVDAARNIRVMHAVEHGGVVVDGNAVGQLREALDALDGVPSLHGLGKLHGDRAQEVQDRLRAEAQTVSAAANSEREPKCPKCGDPLYDNGTVYVHRVKCGEYMVDMQECPTVPSLTTYISLAPVKAQPLSAANAATQDTATLRGDHEKTVLEALEFMISWARRQGAPTAIYTARDAALAALTALQEGRDNLRSLLTHWEDKALDLDAKVTALQEERERMQAERRLEIAVMEAARCIGHAEWSNRCERIHEARVRLERESLGPGRNTKKEGNHA